MRIAVIGYGYWGPNVARSFAQAAGASNVVVCDQRAERLAKARVDLPGIETMEDWTEALQREDVAALAICTPAVSHFDMATKALAAGKHVLVEKPAVLSTDEAIALAAQARGRGLVLMAGHVFRYSPAANALRELIQSGRLGEVRYVFSDRMSLGPRAREDVSVVWDYLIHDVYLLPWLLDRPIRSVRASGGAYLRPGVPDVVFAQWEFGDGIIASSRSSWYAPEKLRTLVVVGSHGMALLDDLKPEPLTFFERGYEPHEGIDGFGNDGLRLFDGGGEPVPVPQGQSLLLECEAFLSAVSGGASEAEGVIGEMVDTTAVCEATERSLASGWPEVIELSRAWRTA